MGLGPELLSSLKSIGFIEPTDVQKEAIPPILRGKDVVVRAKTGTGKTGAFLIPIINSIKKGERNTALIIVPTRELAVQITGVANAMTVGMGLSTVTVYGGASINAQISSLRRGANIIAGTPGRLIDLIERGELKTEGIKFLVLDEADIMFEMGFVEHVEYIISRLPTVRQTMMFSATMPSQVLSIAKKHMKDPVRISVGSENEVTVSTISHHYAITNGYQKFSMLLAYINEFKPKKAIIFTATQRGADRIYTMLKKNGFDVVTMHGGLSQAKREYALGDFRNRAQFMIATNVASRGLDITDISDIINFDASDDPAVYVHRVGRSARMGAEGRAFTIFTERERYLINSIFDAAKVKMKQIELNTEPYKHMDTAHPMNIMRGSGFGSSNRSFSRFGGRGPRRGGYGQGGGRQEGRFRNHDEGAFGERKSEFRGGQRSRFGGGNRRFNHRDHSSRM